MDRPITPINPPERYGLIRPGCRTRRAGFPLRVHGTPARKNATFHPDPGPPENASVLGRPTLITMGRRRAGRRMASRQEQQNRLPAMREAAN